jgi:hypothetical protein
MVVSSEDPKWDCVSLSILCYNISKLYTQIVVVVVVVIIIIIIIIIYTVISKFHFLFLSVSIYIWNTDILWWSACIFEFVSLNLHLSLEVRQPSLTTQGSLGSFVITHDRLSVVSTQLLTLCLNEGGGSLSDGKAAGAWIWPLTYT